MIVGVQEMGRAKRVGVTGEILTRAARSQLPGFESHFCHPSALCPSGRLLYFPISQFPIYRRSNNSPTSLGGFEGFMSHCMVLRVL